MKGTSANQSAQKWTILTFETHPPFSLWIFVSTRSVPSNKAQKQPSNWLLQIILLKWKLPEMYRPRSPHARCGSRDSNTVAASLLLSQAFVTDIYRQTKYERNLTTWTGLHLTLCICFYLANKAVTPTEFNWCNSSSAVLKIELSGFLTVTFLIITDCQSAYYKMIEGE